jgi:hypothetical protein
MEARNEKLKSELSFLGPAEYNATEYNATSPYEIIE